MASRIELALSSARAEGRTGLVTFVTAGDPDLATSARVLLALDRGGADVVEVGVPFSDPVADGPVIQQAAGRALAAGTSLDAVLDLCATVGPLMKAPIVLFSYLNPILRLGTERFAERAAASSVDGVLVVDLPVEEADPLNGAIRAVELNQIFLVSPTTRQERIRMAASIGSGFLYAISTLGVTGARTAVSDEARALVRRMRTETTLPVAVGFGVSHPDHVREIGRWADAAVVGSSIVDLVARSTGSNDIEDRIQAHVRWLAGTGEPGPR